MFLYPGHCLALQEWDWELIPEHAAPPAGGGGLVQVRLRVCKPLPQVKLQSPQALHADHLPLTKERKQLQRNLATSAFLIHSSNIQIIALVS